MDALTARIGALRRRKKELELDVQRLEATAANLEKLLESREDPALAQRLAAVQPQLEVAQGEAERVADELEGLEHERLEQAESIDELERLVDSFAAVAQKAPELATVLNAMRLMVGALATARRLQRSQPGLTEPSDIVASLTRSLLLLAETMSRAAGHETLRES
ncbi:MAG: hypothetical protein Q8N26_36415 [Myxococcales bacterium]|nr:hypothetical protein [Myxococcales bacterium]